MEAYKPYVDYLTAGGVTQTAYLLSLQGAICGTNLPIKAMPQYNFDLVDDKDPNVTHKVVVDERVNLLEALANQGVCKNKAGIRLYNQKYYTTRFDENLPFANKLLYLKKEKGGACICVTKQFILIGTFNTELKMSNGVNQNTGELNKRVQSLALTLFKQGS